jgi:hypothetical protein
LQGWVLSTEASKLQSLVQRRETDMHEGSELRIELNCMLHFHGSCFSLFSFCVLELGSRFLEFSLVHYLFPFQYKTKMPCCYTVFKFCLMFSIFSMSNLYFPNGPHSFIYLQFNWT